MPVGRQALLMYQPFKLVDYEKMSHLFLVAHDEFILSLVLAFVKVSFSEFKFLIILFLLIVYYSSCRC